MKESDKSMQAQSHLPHLNEDVGYLVFDPPLIRYPSPEDLRRRAEAVGRIAECSKAWQGHGLSSTALVEAVRREAEGYRSMTPKK